MAVEEGRHDIHLLESFELGLGMELSNRAANIESKQMLANV